MDLRGILKQFNLNKKEASIYLATLELGTSTASKIAKKAQIQRTYFYDLSDKLIKLGLLKQISKGKKRMFNALKPDKLLELQKNRLQRLEKALPEFKALDNTMGYKSRIFYYEGPEGISQVNKDKMEYRGEFVVFATPHFTIKGHQRLGKKLIEKRVEAGDRVRIIGEVSKEILGQKQRDKEDLRDTRMLPKEVFSSEVEIAIYGNKISIVDYREEFGFEIEGLLNNDMVCIMVFLF